MDSSAAFFTSVVKNSFLRNPYDNFVYAYLRQWNRGFVIKNDLKLMLQNVLHFMSVFTVHNDV